MSVGRVYGQMCGLAAALDVIGERWALLLVRDLLIKPRRFGELQSILPGISSAVLAQRLRELQDAGLVEARSVPTDGRARVYHLTQAGEELRPAVLHLARWGLTFIGTPGSGAVDASWAVLAIEALITDKQVDGPDETYSFEVGDLRFWVQVVGHSVKLNHEAPPGDPVLALRCDAATFMRIGGRLLEPVDAMISGQLEVDGDPVALGRCAALLELAVAVSATR